MKKKLVVIGGGAAGFFCAINAATQNMDLEVLILEKSSKVLSKVSISGGGRCNVTHACFSLTDMVRNYPRGGKFLKKSFRHFFTTDTVSWFEQRGITLKTEPDGRMFPASDSSETIIQCFLKEAERLGIQILLNKQLIRVDRRTEGSKSFHLFFKQGESLEADILCIACGGFPKSLQYQWLTDLGHHFEPPVPSLFTFNLANPLSELMGISVEQVVIKIDGTRYVQAGPLLITHWGLSGPAILKLSAFAALDLARRNYDFSVTINWTGTLNEQTLLEKMKTLRFDLAAKKMSNYNPFGLPRRLWEYHLQLADIEEHIRWADLPAKKQNILVKILTGQSFNVKGKTTFKEEFVTAGGITLEEIIPETMESKLIPDLFFAGEILNVDGITGGFNFQHAWTSGWIAANEIAKR